MIQTETTPETPPPGPPRRRLRVAILTFLALGALAIAGTAIYTAWAMGGSSTGRQVEVAIREGATGAEIAGLLEDRGVIRSALVFRVVARVRGVDSDLKPGVYELRTGLGVSGVLDLLRRGIEPEFVRITVPEGATVIEVARAVARGSHITERAFLREARSGRHRISIMPKGSRNLEGLLFPKTYDVAEDTTAGRLIERMLDQFESETAGLSFRRAHRMGLSSYEAVILASLVEREARVQADRPKVASVIYNRLDKPMRLEIDATVQYAILLQTGRYKGEGLTSTDYRTVQSPYNTYLHDGLPPAPIAAPGLAAMRAALDPAATDFFYYVLGPDGKSHLFARTLAEHNENRRRR